LCVEEQPVMMSAISANPATKKTAGGRINVRSFIILFRPNALRLNVRKRKEEVKSKVER
jgi:hypothetical protein